MAFSENMNFNVEMEMEIDEIIKVSVKSVLILSIFVAFLENANFKDTDIYFGQFWKKSVRI